jgi:hypothetical protein
MNTNKEILLIQNSNPYTVYIKAKEYLTDDTVVKMSNRKNKKYMVLNPNTNKYVHFGDINYQDFTKHNDPVRRDRYLKRTENIKGDWKSDLYSSNNLSRVLLWNA